MVNTAQMHKITQFQKENSDFKGAAVLPVHSHPVKSVSCSPLFYTWTNYHFAANTFTHNKQTTRKAVTRSRTDYFAAGVTYLPYPIQVCFSATLPELVFPRPLSFSSKGTFPHVALIENHRAKYRCKRLAYLVRKYGQQTHTDTQQFDSAPQTTKSVASPGSDVRRGGT